MPRKRQPPPRWLPALEEHNFPAAESCLSLIYPAAAAAKLALELRAAAAARGKGHLPGIATRAAGLIFPLGRFFSIVIDMRPYFYRSVIYVAHRFNQDWNLPIGNDRGLTMEPTSQVAELAIGTSSILKRENPRFKCKKPSMSWRSWAWN